MSRYGAADNTITSALRELSRLGMVKVEHGKGSYVIRLDALPEDDPGLLRKLMLQVEDMLKRLERIEDHVGCTKASQ